MKYLTYKDFLDGLEAEVKNKTLLDIEGTCNFDKDLSLSVSASIKNQGWVNAEIDLTFVYKTCETYKEAVHMIRDMFDNAVEKQRFRHGNKDVDMNAYEYIKDNLLVVRCINESAYNKIPLCDNIPFSVIPQTPKEDVYFVLVKLGKGETIYHRRWEETYVNKDMLDEWKTDFSTALNYALRNNKKLVLPKLGYLTDAIKAKQKDKHTATNMYTLSNALAKGAFTALYYENFLRSTALNFNMQEFFIIPYEDSPLLINTQGQYKKNLLTLAGAMYEKSPNAFICPDIFCYRLDDNKLSIIHEF